MGGEEITTQIWNTRCCRRRMKQSTIDSGARVGKGRFIHKIKSNGEGQMLKNGPVQLGRLFWDIGKIKLSVSCSVFNNIKLQIKWLWKKSDKEKQSITL